MSADPTVHLVNLPRYMGVVRFTDTRGDDRRISCGHHHSTRDAAERCAAREAREVDRDLARATDRADIIDRVRSRPSSPVPEPGEGDAAT